MTRLLSALLWALTPLRPVVAAIGDADDDRTDDGPADPCCLTGRCIPQDTNGATT